MVEGCGKTSTLTGLLLYKTMKKLGRRMAVQVEISALIGLVLFGTMKEREVIGCVKKLQRLPPILNPILRPGNSLTGSSEYR